MTSSVPTPVRTVLTTTRRHGVRALLMGGQACILYGASEFSRDVDLAIYAHPDNLGRLQRALDELGASVTAVPPFAREYLERGHAVHFRCAAAEDMRLDIMAVMRNVPDFETCRGRRTIATLDEVGEGDVLGLEDLVAAKKTRLDKDWPMIRRLVDVHYAEFANEPTDRRLAFWLRELRPPPRRWWIACVGLQKRHSGWRTSAKRSRSHCRRRSVTDLCGRWRCRYTMRKCESAKPTKRIGGRCCKSRKYCDTPRGGGSVRRLAAD
jgi:hypothetical protein